MLHVIVRRFVAPILVSSCLAFFPGGSAQADALAMLAHYFDIDKSSPHSIPLDELQQGCPRPGCIPAIDKPDMVAAQEADFLDPGDFVLALEVDGVAHAYPVVILDRHEIVNGYIGDLPIAVTWCPLCGSGLVYRRQFGDELQLFRVSGFLHNSDLVMFDEATRSLWGQISGEAIAGPLTGTQLEAVQATITEWAQWREAHPDTLVLSRNTGFSRRYEGSPYGDYAESSRLMFPVSNRNFRIHPKTVVFGIRHAGEAVAVTEALLQEDARVEMKLDGRQVEMQLMQDGTARARFTGSGESLTTTRLFWFGWLNFNPQTQLLGGP